LSTNKNVLLVGGNGALLAGGEGPLENAGIGIRRAPTGVEGLLLHRAQRANLIVTELDLPDLTAEHFCKAVRAEKVGGRVALVVLCPGDEAARRRAAECGANAHFVLSPDAESIAVELTHLLAVPLRAKYRVLARVSVDEEERSFFCTSDNLSATGILVETDEALALGQTVDCSFFLPGRLQVATQGKVVREVEGAAGRQFGIQFVDLPRQEAAKLDSFVTGWRNLR